MHLFRFEQDLVVAESVPQAYALLQHHYEDFPFFVSEDIQIEKIVQVDDAEVFHLADCTAPEPISRTAGEWARRNEPGLLASLENK